MRILLFYHQAWRQVGYDLEKYFAALGHDVSVVMSDTTAYWTNFYGKFPFYVPKKWPLSIQTLEAQFHKNFDGVIEVDGTGQHHLTGFKKFSGFKLLWSLDTHVPAKRKFQQYIQKDFDFLFSCHKDYLSYFSVPIAWLPPACDLDTQKKMDIPEVYDVVFIGNMDKQRYPERVRLLELLSRRFKVGAFGQVFGADAVKIFNQGKIIFNSTFNGDLNLRVFESLAYGKLLLTENVGNGLKDLFHDGEHLVLYNNQDDLVSKVQYYLDHTQERLKIASQGHALVRQKHTFYHRAKEMLDVALNHKKQGSL